jgi:hypothetical protein
LVDQDRSNVVDEKGNAGRRGGRFHGMGRKPRDYEKDNKTRNCAAKEIQHASYYAINPRALFGVQVSSPRAFL